MRDRIILHVDFNSYFATIEQQANPRLRGKPIGVTGGDRLQRTVLGAASVEAKKYGVKTGMHLYEALRLCPQIVLVKGDSDKYLECSKRFWNILKRYSPDIEIFSIDEVFLELKSKEDGLDWERAVKIGMNIKEDIYNQIGEWVRCSVGISYNKLMSKLASSLFKPDGMVVIEDKEAAEFVLDRVELDEICGIGYRIKKRLNNIGIYNFKQLREIPLENLIASFKYHLGNTLYNMARGLDYARLVRFFEKPEVRSVGHRLTINHDTDDLVEIKQILLKLSELVARRLRAKRLVCKTVHCYFRDRLDYSKYRQGGMRGKPQFSGDGMQITIPFTDDGLDIFKASFGIFNQIWYREKLRMIGVSVSNLAPKNPQNLSLLEDFQKREVITRALDKINNRYGEFTLQRGILLGTKRIRRMANSFMSDRRFNIEGSK